MILRRLLWSKQNLKFSFIFKGAMPYALQTLSTTTTASVTDCDIEILALPNKAIVDRKLYRAIKLPNALTALLISDPTAVCHSDDRCIRQIASNLDDDDEHEEDDDNEDTGSSEGSETELTLEDDKSEISCTSRPTKYLAAASLCIGVGSFEDPDEFPGLMHFLEHMVFMGSEKYPKENAFSEFISKHGGSDNAHTDLETTTFYFEIQEQYLREALDRMAQFFISPLMLKDSMDREKEAVHSEFQIAEQDDEYCRAQLFCKLAIDGHPMGKFTWGNKNSLNSKNFEQLYDSIHKMRLKHYSSQHMTLAVQSRDDLDVLQKMIADIFGQICNNEKERPLYQNLEFPFPPANMKKKFYVVPVKDAHSVELIWALPVLLKHYNAKPLNYISYLLGHEGKGSLLSYFKKKVWAVGLYAGNDDSEFEMNSTYSYFSISVELTENGFKNVEYVVYSIFQYLQMVQNEGPLERIFKEIQMVENLKFNYNEEASAVDNVQELSETMQKYPPVDYLTGDYLLENFNSNLIEECIAHLSPETCHIVFSSKSYENVYEEFSTEKWFGTKYVSEDISQNWVENMYNVVQNEQLSLPLPNLFLPKSLEIIELGPTLPEFPELLIKEEFGELWFKPDTKFNLPRAYCYVHLLSDLLLKTPQYAALLDLFCNLFAHQIMEDIYPATLLQYTHSVIPSERGLVITLSGFNNKLLKCFELIVNHIEDFVKHLNEASFEQIKQQQIKAYCNAAIKPSTLVKDLRLSIIQDIHWTVIEKLDTLKSITMQTLSEFVGQFILTSYCRILIQGNLYAEEAGKFYQVLKNLKDKFSSDVIFPYPEHRAIKLPFGEKILRVKNLNEKDRNSFIVNYYQGCIGTVENEVYNEFILLIMNEPAFDFLRTQEQLGYNVYCTNRNTFGILGISVTVNTQATKFTTDYVNQKIEAFLTMFKYKLENMTSEEISVMKNTLINMKMNVDMTLREEVDRNWQEIVDGEYIFERRQRQIQIIKNTSKENIVNWFRSVVCDDIPTIRKLSVQVEGSSADSVSSAIKVFQETSNDPYVRVHPGIKFTKMSPKYPEEIDVFSTPHIRMKELVSTYSHWVQCIDFSDGKELWTFLKGLTHTLYEFKSHELIENKFIMNQLKQRLAQSHIYNSAVCNCHNDSRLGEMLLLVQSGKKFKEKSIGERISYGMELQHAFNEFVSTFLPHMEEEEEVFQPLLIEHFEYDELKILKDVVIKEHELVKEKQENEKIHYKKPEFSDSSQSLSAKDTSVDTIAKVALKKEDFVNKCLVQDFEDLSCASKEYAYNIPELPVYILTEIFQYLDLPDRCNCAQVCWAWNNAAYAPVLWKEIYPVQWARGIWCYQNIHLSEKLEDEIWKETDYQFQKHDEDADTDESEKENNPIVECEKQVMIGLIQHVLPRVGEYVSKITIDVGVSTCSRLVQHMLGMCPNLISFSASYTALNHYTFKGLRSGSLSKLQNLNLQGCEFITDTALEYISTCLSKKKCATFGCQINGLLSDDFMSCEKCDFIHCPWLNSVSNFPITNIQSYNEQSRYDIEDVYLRQKIETSDEVCLGSSSLVSLSLSGCFRISDDGILVLLDNSVLSNIHSLDLSGCWLLSGHVLHTLSQECPSLLGENLSYCDNINGPFSACRGGCANLCHPLRACCRS